VNFNGTGTVAIRASGNVSSITDSSTGNYIVNFTTAMADANYSVSVSGAEAYDSGANIYVLGARQRVAIATSSVSVCGYASAGGGKVDVIELCVAVFR
jgi:hypothetical protein